MSAETRILDCTGARCGVLAVKTKKALDKLASGERVMVVSDDVAALSDVQHLGKRLGFRVVSSEKTPEQVKIVLERV